jgi:hypothetical protein
MPFASRRCRRRAGAARSSPGSPALWRDALLVIVDPGRHVPRRSRARPWLGRIRANASADPQLNRQSRDIYAPPSSRGHHAPSHHKGQPTSPSTNRLRHPLPSADLTDSAAMTAALATRASDDGELIFMLVRRSSGSHRTFGLELTHACARPPRLRPTRTTHGSRSICCSIWRSSRCTTTSSSPRRPTRAPRCTRVHSSAGSRRSDVHTAASLLAARVRASMPAWRHTALTIRTCTLSRGTTIRTPRGHEQRTTVSFYLWW